MRSACVWALPSGAGLGGRELIRQGEHPGVQLLRLTSGDGWK